MLTFHYSAKINALPAYDEKKLLETLTGTLQAESHTEAREQAKSLAFHHCRKLEQERGGTVGYESVQVECQTSLDHLVPALVEVTFLNRLKHQIRDVTRALDTTGRFGQSLEATSVKHAVEILWSELSVHGLLPEPRKMTPQDYSKCALRTLYPDLTTNERLGLCGLGLSGEIGEVTDSLKKFLSHRNGKPLDRDKLKDELGDVLWYYAVLLDTLGLTFEDVMLANAIKCDLRHPNGFNPHYTSDSHASEEEL